MGGGDGGSRNPVFYISSGSWNLYRMLEEFLDFRGFPPGPILLRDIGLDENRFLAEDHSHKLAKIDRVLDRYPGLPFVLIGDSGQDDPGLYVAAVKRRPGRVLAIYIRDVSPDRRGEMRALERAAQLEGVPLVLAASSAEIAADAAERGLISPQAVELVSAEKPLQLDATIVPPCAP